MPFACHLYAIRMPFVCHLYVICMSNVCTRMLLVCHTDVTRMYSYVICMLLVYYLYTLMPSVCHLYVFVYHPCVTRMYSYVIHMSSKPLVCGLTVNLYYMQMLPVNRHNTVLVRMELPNDFQLITYFSCLKNVQKSSALTH